MDIVKIPKKGHQIDITEKGYIAIYIGINNF